MTCLENTWKSDGRHILFLLYMYSIQGVVFSLYVVFEMILVEKGRSFREVALFASCGAIQLCQKYLLVESSISDW